MTVDEPGTGIRVCLHTFVQKSREEINYALKFYKDVFFTFHFSCEMIRNRTNFLPGKNCTVITTEIY